MKTLSAALFLIAMQNGVAACVIQGTVRDSDSGKPLPNVKIFARPRTGRTRAAILRVANAEGSFCFNSLDPGPFDLMAERSGYLDYLYGARPGGEHGTPLLIKSGAELPAFTLEMVPAASISGMAFDSAGEPMERADVALLRKVWDHGWSTEGVDSRDTDDQGVFRFVRLAPGTYYLEVDPQDRDVVDGAHTMTAPTFYGGSFNVGGATPISLKPGQEITNLSVNIGRVVGRRLSGRVIAAPGSKMPQGFELLESSGYDSTPIALAKDGTFSVASLLPSRYKFRPGGPQTPSIAEVDLTSGDVNGFVLELAPTFEVRISARVEGGAALGGLQVEARAIEGKTVQDGRGQGDGTYVFRALPAGLYGIETNGDNLYLKNLVIDGETRTDALLDLRKGQPKTVEAVLSPNVARLEGHADQAPSGLGATVVLLDETAPRPVPVDQAGNFTLESLAPGKHRVLVIQGFEEHLWGSPELSAVLKPQSIEFEVHESETKELVVPVISSDEWAGALRKVGL